MSEQTTEIDQSQWGKARDHWDRYYAIWCGSDEPHPRHSHRAFAGGHNTEIVTCLGRAPVSTPPGVTS